MRFTETAIVGAFIIEMEAVQDDRGFFSRTWCQKEFAANGLNSSLVQCNLSYNRRKGTLRGMHYQATPYGETKLVSCVRGSIYDVILDLRKDSRTYKQWCSINLYQGDRKSLYIPEGVAHGFLTLDDDTEVFYQMSEYYHSDSARGVRWDDPQFKINWPIEDGLIISDRDKNYSRYQV